MADRNGINNSIISATDLGTLTLNSHPSARDVDSRFLIEDSTSIFSFFNLRGGTPGFDSVDYFTFDPSGLDSVSVTFNTSGGEDFARYLIVVPESGVVSVDGAVVGTWLSGVHDGRGTKFTNVVNGAAGDTAEAFRNGEFSGNIDATNATFVEDVNGSAGVVWELDGSPVRFYVQALGFEGRSGGQFNNEIIFRDTDYALEVTATGRSFSGLAGDGQLFNNTTYRAETHIGGDGIDYYTFNGARSGITVQSGDDQSLRVKTDGGISQPDTLYNIERVKLTDGYLAFDTDGNAGQIYRLYQAAFDRDPDVAGLGHWIDTFDQGLFDLTGVAEEFLISEEFQTRFGTEQTLDDQAFLTLLYNNVLDRDPDQAGFDFWSVQQSQGLSRAEMLQHFSESEENYANVAGEIGDGIFYL